MGLLTKNQGFTLIELMIVVGIIGILVSIAAPNYQRYVRKSRQTEAKIALAGIYLGEKAFYSEYTAYVPSMDAIGYVPEGDRRFYRLGWGINAWSHSITGYSGTTATGLYAPLKNPYSTGCSFGACPGYNGSINASPFDVDNPQQFVATAAGRLSETTTNAECDCWIIDENRFLRNDQTGI